MKLVIYNIGNLTLEVFEGLTNVQIDGNNVEWSNGRLKGIKQNFIVVSDDVVIPDYLTEEIIALDQREIFKKVDLVKENQELKERLLYAENAILTLMDRM